MALSSTCIIDVRNGGSDTANGALFNPGATLTANGAATVANTSSPVFTSPSYNFVAGDVGAWLFIKSGTNWIPGWYQIASVASNAATLSAGIGQAILYNATTGLPSGFNTVAGCATTASPTSASWTVDYSQQTAAQFSLTGLTTSAANAIILTASATVAMIGNGIIITAGTNFTTGTYQINSVSAGVSITVDRNCTTAAGAAGTAGIGGGLASPGSAGALATVSGMTVFVLYNASAFVASSTSTNISGGCVLGSNGTIWQGWATSRYVLNTDANRPTFQIGSGVSTAILFTGTNNAYSIFNFILDGNGQTTSKGTFQSGTCWNLKGINFTNAVFNGNSGSQRFYYCEVTSCTLASNVSCILLSSNGYAEWCWVHDNTLSGTVASGFAGANGGTSSCVNCISSNSNIGFYLVVFADHCNAYGNASNGFDVHNNSGCILSNCISEGNGGAAYLNNAGSQNILQTCASYNNTGGRLSGAWIDPNPINGSSSFFTNAAGNVFSLNNTAGAGALLRGLGFPATFPAGLTPNFADVGAAQHQDSGGGGIFIGSSDLSGGLS